MRADLLIKLAPKEVNKGQGSDPSPLTGIPLHVKITVILVLGDLLCAVGFCGAEHFFFVLILKSAVQLLNLFDPKYSGSELCHDLLNHLSAWAENEANTGENN